jgi:RNA polymerase sigma factor (sigma-70 family)
MSDDRAPREPEEDGDADEGAGPEDAEILDRLRNGDPEAWRLFNEKYFPEWRDVYRGKLGKDLRGAYGTEDLVQSVMGQIFKDLGKLRDEAAFFAWVHTIFRRKIVNRRRKAGKLRRVPIESIDDVREGGSPDPASGEDEDRVLDCMIRYFATHPEYMSVFYFKHFEERSTEEIAERLGRSPRMVQRMLKAARELLRGGLAGPPP